MRWLPLLVGTPRRLAQQPHGAVLECAQPEQPAGEVAERGEAQGGEGEGVAGDGVQVGEGEVLDELTEA